MLTTLRFIELNESHIPPILEIENEANSAPWTERSFKNELGNPDRIFLVALLEGKVVGYGGIWLIIDEAHVTTVAVAAEHRQKGIGRRLMIELLERAKSEGMTCSTLEVRASNSPALNLYAELGYKDTARRKKYYPDNQEDAVVMWMYDLQAWRA
ncbi:MAG TPA: ribosomal protein S18-alanine N-acetyltransferase [Fimbriimonas sp.]|nr:ribosomal protein S18-alanine N-acetyltransferase [Fimbriimonas sp.]